MKPFQGPRPAAGPSLRLPGVSRDAALHDPLYRCAQDLQQQLERHAALDRRHRTLLESRGRQALGQDHAIQANRT